MYGTRWLFLGFSRVGRHVGRRGGREGGGGLRALWSNCGGTAHETPATRRMERDVLILREDPERILSPDVGRQRYLSFIGQEREDEREREGEWMQLQFVENEQPPIEDWEEREIQETMVRLNEGMAALLEEEEMEARRQREAVAVDDEDEDEEEEDEDEEEEEAVVCVSDVLFLCIFYS